MISNVRITTRVTVASALGLAVMLAVGLLGFLNARSLGQHLDAVADDKFPGAAALARIEANQSFAMRGINAQFMTRLSDDLRVGAQGFVETALGAIEEARREFESRPQSAEVAAAWGAMQAPYEAWRTDALAMLAQVRERDRLVRAGLHHESEEVIAREDEAWRHWVRLREELPAFQEALRVVQERIGAEVTAARLAGAAATRQNTRRALFMVLLGVVVMAGSAWSLSRSVGSCVAALRGEAERLSRAIAGGALDARGDPASAGKDFEPVVAGMNEIVEAFVPPMRLSIAYINDLSRGVKPPPVEGDWSGEFRALKDGWNALIAVLDMRASDLELLTAAARKGDLGVRADVARYAGYNGKMIAGVHEMLDAIAAPLRESGDVLQRLARRDLTARMTGTYGGDYARIRDAVNASAGALEGALAQVAEAVGQLSAAAAQIAASSQSVADGASEQASSLEETSSQLEAMAGMTRHASENARQADGLAEQARAAAGHGAASADQLSAAMARIRASAEATSEIIRDINEIAFQTNLLALNAAVEAARAGEAGRGFAVVAEEVRALALRSKNAAGRTEELIRQSVNQAAQGEDASRQVAGRLAEIVAAIGKVSAIVAEMSATARDQASGIAQVSAAVTEVDRVTQQNAASAEESSSAASELATQSEELAAMVGTFRLGGDAAGAASGSARQPPSGGDVATQFRPESFASASARSAASRSC